jgi:hypothetical protein
MESLHIENTFDFETVSGLFESLEEQTYFECLSSALECIHEGKLHIKSRELHFLRFYNFIENKMKVTTYEKKFEKYFRRAKRSLFASVKCAGHNKYNQYSFYDAYMILKYMTLDEHKRYALRDIFRQDTCEPVSIFNIRNNDFVQGFFSVTQELEYIDIIRKLDFHSPQTIDELIMHSWTVNVLIKKFQCVEIRFNYIFYVTQNIVFDKTNFENDFVARFHFAKTISGGRNKMDVFSPLLSWYHNDIILKEIFSDILADTGLEMSIRRLYYDSITVYDRWTHTKFAQRMDNSYLLPYVSEFYNKEINDKVITFFVEKEFWTLKIYIEYIDLFEKIQRTCSPPADAGEYSKFMNICESAVKNIPLDTRTLEEITVVFT